METPKVRRETCLRCGIEGVASTPVGSSVEIIMLKYAWNAQGTYLGKFRCRDRKPCEKRVRQNRARDTVNWVEF